MDQDRFTAADRQLDKIANLLNRAVQSLELRAVREALAALGKSLGDRYSVNLTCVVEVFDDKMQRTLPMLHTGLSVQSGAEPFPITGDSSPQRYVVDGQIQVVPHDRCPKCWGAWDFKWDSHRCPHRDAELGRNCKVLLDSDVCPLCEEGSVSVREPECSECGFVVDPALVVWG
jgi:hypothetical protein